MARGSEIIVSANPQGKFTEGYIAAAQTPSPGTILEIDPTIALKGGRHTYKLYNQSADGDQPLGAFWVLLPDWLQGRLATTAYAAGERCFLYSPIAGEELNLLLKDIAGTSATSDHAAGEKLTVDTSTGLLIATTGTPETECAVLLETLNDLTADTLAWCQWSGH